MKNEKTPEKIKPGCEVLVKGDLQEIPLPSNPGQFHERAYYYPRKIKWYQEASGVEVTEPEKDKFLCVQAKLKERLKKGIYSTVSEKKAEMCIRDRHTAVWIPRMPGLPREEV